MADRRTAPAVSALGRDLDSGESVALPHEIRDLGATVLGQTGYGKTTLLEQLILQDIERGTSVIVVDAHGDLTQRVLSLAQTYDEDLLLLEAWEDAPFRLNLFDCPDPTSAIAVDRTVSGIVQVFKRLFGSPREFYPRLERDLGNATRTVIANNGTLLDVPRLFWDPEFRAAALQQVTNPRVQEFWRLWERIGRADRQLEQLEATINRLDQFLASEFVAQVVGSTESTVPFDEVLDGTGQVLLVSLPVGEIGEGLTNLLGSLFLAVLTERIFARSRLAPGDRPRVHLYLDEYGRYATPTTAQLLTEGRKFGIGTTIAHQTRAQVPDEENRAAELQVGTLICFQLIGEDAQELSGEFSVAPEPQWEERVEEIEGTEPVLAISQRPVEHLLQATHESPDVRAIVQRQLFPLQQAVDGATPSVSFLLHPMRKRHVQEGLDLIRSLLVDVMEQRVPATPEALAQLLGDVAVALREYLGMTPSTLTSTTYFYPYSHKVEECLQEFVGECLTRPAAKQFFTRTPRESELVDLLVGEWRYVQEREAYKHVRADDQQRAFAQLYEGEPEERERLTRVMPEVRDRVTDLFALCRHLAEQPILVPSGQEKPRVRVRYITHPQRSYQDVQNELAVQLANLPRFTAYASIQGEQHQLRLNPPTEGKIDEARIERVRQTSKARFGRPSGSPEESAPGGIPERAAASSASPRIARDHPDEE